MWVRALHGSCINKILQMCVTDRLILAKKKKERKFKRSLIFIPTLVVMNNSFLGFKIYLISELKRNRWFKFMESQKLFDNKKNKARTVRSKFVKVNFNVR